MNNKIVTLIQALLFATLFIIVIPAQSQSVDEQYKQAIESADSYFEKADYLNAKASYQVASQLKPDEQYPKDRMKESIDLLKVQMEKMAVYNAKLDYADQLFRDESWDNAILAYEEALMIMPDQNYPVQQINLIKDLKAEEAGKEAAYTAFLKEGDERFATGDLTSALGKYEEAHVIYPSRQEVNDRIDEVEKKLTEIAAQQSDYEKAISDAGMYHARKDYENELLSYRKAAELKPDEPMPQIKIQELNEFLRKYEAYNSFVAEGDELYISQKFAEARIKYEKALEILPDENYPREIISKINIALTKKTEKDKAAYEEAIAKADELYNQEDYEAAMVAYSDALRFWPDGEHAQERLGSISEIMALKKAKEEAYAHSISLADKLFAEKDYAGAKAEYLKASEINPFEQYPKVRMDEIDMILAELQSKLDQYDAVVQGADKLFNVGDYEQARIQYLRAQEILSDRSYPADQIRMIDEILGKEKTTREDYDAAISRADEHFTKREWEDAKVDYVEANDIIPEEQYPKDKITEINNIMAQLQADRETFELTIKTADELYAAKDYRGALAKYQNAVAMFSDEVYPQQKIEEINTILSEEARLAGIDESYNTAVATADGLFADESFAEAKTEYEKASGLKPQEQYPKDKMAEIDGIFAAEQELEENYNNAITAGDASFATKDYNAAKASYNTALEYKPNEAYPTDKIAEIDSILAEIAAQKQAIEDSYNEAVASGDEYLGRGAYLEALQSYNHALEIKPDETYPKEKIAEINSNLTELEAERQKAYDAAIVQADNYYNMGNYRSAKSAYQTAVDIKPDETYARERLDEVSVLYMAELETLKVEYRKYIADADNYFNEKIYDGAIENYRTAAGILPDEPYPGQMIARITKIINDNAITDVNKLAQVIPNNTDKKFPFSALPVNVRKENYILIKARNVGSHAFKMLLNFGMDNVKNGGIVLQVPEENTSKDYIIRIGAMYKWFSEDNNWLSIYPEGGDIEVALIRISKSD